MSGWTYEVHELSEGFSAIVYDEHGLMVADHLSEERAAKIAAAPDLLNACEAMQQRIIEAMDLERISPAMALEEMAAIVRAAIAKALPTPTKDALNG